MKSTTFGSHVMAFLILSVGATPTFMHSVFAADYPTRPITVIVPYAPGGTSELLFRLISGRISELHGTTFVLDAKPGAGGNLGADIVAKSKPDGYTLLAGASALTISPAMYRKLPFDPLTAFVPISLFARAQMVLVAKKTFAANTIPELIKLAKEKPGTLTYGSSGVGTINQLAMESFKLAAGIDVLHVPYKGSGQAFQSLLGGEIHLGVSSNVVEEMASGQIKALATLSNTPNPHLPGVPAVSQFIPNYKGTAVWFGILAPAGTPREIVDLLNGYVNEAARSADIVKRLNGLGYEVLGTNSKQFAALMKEEIESYKAIVTAAKIPPE